MDFKTAQKSLDNHSPTNHWPTDVPKLKEKINTRKKERNRPGIERNKPETEK